MEDSAGPRSVSHVLTTVAPLMIDDSNVEYNRACVEVATALMGLDASYRQDVGTALNLIRLCMK